MVLERKYLLLAGDQKRGYCSLPQQSGPVVLCGRCSHGISDMHIESCPYYLTKAIAGAGRSRLEI